MIIEHISIELMIADPLTKSMLVMKFKDHVEIQFMKLISIRLISHFHVHFNSSNKIYFIWT